MSERSSGPTVSGRAPAKSRSSPAAARPTVPARKSESPGWAPERRIADSSPTVPSAVMAMTMRPEDDRSPPMIGTVQSKAVPARSASSKSPEYRASRQAMSVSSGTATETSSPCGIAPMAQTSARFWAAALTPSFFQSNHSRVKSSFSTSMSAVETSRPSGAVTAASSPGPTITCVLLGLRPSTREMMCDSPSSDSRVMAPGYRAIR